MSLRHSLSAIFKISALTAAVALVGCHNDELSDAESTAPVATGDTIALTSTGRVVSFDRAPSRMLTSSKAISGLPAGESLISVDMRPANKLFYALSSKGIIYLLDPSTGVLSNPVTLVVNSTTPINTTTCTPAVTAYSGLSGTEFGTDFNPAVDRLRIVSDSGQNLRVNVDNGQTTVDCGLVAGSTPVKGSAVAYTNSVSGVGPQSPAQSTTLYYIDASTAMLYTTTAPNNGMLTAVGSLGVTGVSAVNGFDISTNTTGGTNSAYATLTGTTMRNGVSVTATSFYSINLSTGAATVLADFSENFMLRGLALK